MDTLLFMKWKAFFIVLTISLCLISCSENTSENTPSEDAFLVPQRNDKIQQTKEWQDFSQAWNDYDNFCEAHGPELMPYLKEIIKHLENCLEKVNGLEPLLRQGLISRSELDAMKSYFNYELEYTGIQFQHEAGNKESVNWAKAFYQYIAYNVLKKDFSLIKNIAKQKDCVNWIRGKYLPFLKNEVRIVEKTTPETLKYWNYWKCQNIPESLKYWNYWKNQTISENLKKNLKYYRGELIPPIRLEEVKSFINEVNNLLSDIR